MIIHSPEFQANSHRSISKEERSWGLDFHNSSSRFLLGVNYSTLTEHEHTQSPASPALCAALQTDLSFLSSSWLIRTSWPEASCVFLVKASSSPSSLFFSFNAESAFFSAVLHLFSKATRSRGYRVKKGHLVFLLTFPLFAFSQFPLRTASARLALGLALFKGKSQETSHPAPLLPLSAFDTP